MTEALLARSARKAFEVEDQQAVAFQPDPAAVGEIGERLVYRLPRRPNQLSDLLLRQVVCHPQPGTFEGAEPLRQQQQLLGDAAGTRR